MESNQGPSAYPQTPYRWAKLAYMCVYVCMYTGVYTVALLTPVPDQMPPCFLEHLVLVGFLSWFDLVTYIHVFFCRSTERGGRRGKITTVQCRQCYISVWEHGHAACMLLVVFSYTLPWQQNC